MRPLLVINHWDTLYETYESARVKACSWVAIPNKHDGRGFKRLIGEKDGAALYGAWCVTVQVASKCPVRGVLADLDGPLDALDLQDKTGIPEKILARMLQIACSDRIGWAHQVTDPTQISALLADVSARRSGVPARRAGKPSESAASPADSLTSPADCGRNGKTAGAPAESRSLTHENAPRGRALANRQDRTGPTGPTDTPAGEPESMRAVSALEDTASFLVALFGKKRSRLSQDAEAQLARQAASLPLNDGQKAMLEWFRGLTSPQHEDPALRCSDSADGWARNLFTYLERAEAYAERSGAAKKIPAPIAEPDGWREWLAAEYPSAVAPSAFASLPESIQSEFLLVRKNPVAA